MIAADHWKYLDATNIAALDDAFARADIRENRGPQRDHRDRFDPTRDGKYRKVLVTPVAPASMPPLKAHFRPGYIARAE